MSHYDVIVIGGGEAGLAIGYHLGLPWQHTRGSALLGRVKDDAAHLALHTTNRTQGTPR